MITARTDEEKELIDKMTPIYAVGDKFVISAGDRIYIKKIFTSFATSKMTYSPDYYAEERIARKLIRMKLDISGLNHIGYYRIMDSTLEEIVLYDLNTPHLINLHTNKMKHGLCDEDNKLVDTGMMRSFLVPNTKSNIEDTYKHIQDNLDKDKQYGIVRTQKSEKHPDMSVVAIFEISQKHKKC